MWAATAEIIAENLPEWRMVNEHTSDWGDDEIAELIAVAGRLEASPLDLAACWMSESGLHSTAHNPHGNAAGLFQLMPTTARGLGFHGGWQAFRALSVLEQLHWAERYYAPHRGRLTSAGACYLANFLPAYIAHADTPTFVLCSPTLHPEWYWPNFRALDPDEIGHITVGDLSERIARVTVGARWEEFASRIRDANPANDTEPSPEAA